MPRARREMSGGGRHAVGGRRAREERGGEILDDGG